MTKRGDDIDPLIELLGGHTRLNLRESTASQPAAPTAPRPTRRNRRRQLEFTEVPEAKPEEVFSCPSCGAPGQLDIREGMSGRCYLSCTTCFKMWQEVREPDRAFRQTEETLWQMR